jgi:hypothetical protein
MPDFDRVRLLATQSDRDGVGLHQGRQRLREPVLGRHAGRCKGLPGGWHKSSVMTDSGLASRRLADILIAAAFRLVMEVPPEFEVEPID